MQVAQDAGHTSWQEHPSLPGKEPWALALLPSTVPHTRQVALGASRNPLSPMVLQEQRRTGSEGLEAQTAIHKDGDQQKSPGWAQMPFP